MGDRLPIELLFDHSFQVCHGIIVPEVTADTLRPGLHGEWMPVRRVDLAPSLVNRDFSIENESVKVEDEGAGARAGCGHLAHSKSMHPCAREKQQLPCAGWSLLTS